MPSVSFYSDRMRTYPGLKSHRKYGRSQFSSEPVSLFEHIPVIYELYSGAFISSFSTAIIMRIAYGHRVVSDDDEFIRLTNERGYAMSNSGPPGSTPVDFFPFCK